MLDHLPRAERIQALKAAILACRTRQEHDHQEEAGYLDLLAREEATLGDPAACSGLIDSNPYCGVPVAPAGFSGDLVDPASGKPCGGAGPGGSR